MIRLETSLDAFISCTLSPPVKTPAGSHHAFSLMIVVVPRLSLDLGKGSFVKVGF